jgi:hypothetical protein
VTLVKLTWLTGTYGPDVDTDKSRFSLPVVILTSNCYNTS